MKPEQIYDVIVKRPVSDDYEQTRHVEGTLPEILNVFMKTLTDAKKRIKSINVNPKTIDSLIKNVEKALLVNEMGFVHKTYIFGYTEIN